MTAVAVDRSVLLVHDVVNHFVRDDDPELLPVLECIARLLGAARDGRLPIVFAAPGQGDPAIGIRPAVAAQGRSIWGTVAADVPASLGPRPGEIVIRKPRYGAFFGTALADHLRQTGRDTLIVCGISLAGGVETTVRDADNRDLTSIVVRDACLCRPVPDQGWGPVTAAEVAKVTLSIMAQRFADIRTTDEICAALAAANKAVAP